MLHVLRQLHSAQEWSDCEEDSTCTTEEDLHLGRSEDLQVCCYKAGHRYRSAACRTVVCCEHLVHEYVSHMG